MGDRWKYILNVSAFYAHFDYVEIRSWPLLSVYNWRAGVVEVATVGFIVSPVAKFNTRSHLWQFAHMATYMVILYSRRGWVLERALYCSTFGTSPPRIIYSCLWTPNVSVTYYFCIILLISYFLTSYFYFCPNLNVIYSKIPPIEEL